MSPPFSPSLSPGLVHRFVPAAAGSPGAAGTLLLLHGTGGDESDLLPLGAQVAHGHGWNLLSPRGSVLENGMPRFFRRLAVVVPVENTARLAELLVRSGAQVTESWHPGGHELSPGDLQATSRWLSNVGDHFVGSPALNRKGAVVVDHQITVKVSLVSKPWVPERHSLEQSAGRWRARCVGREIMLLAAPILPG